MKSAHILDYLRRRDGDLIARFGQAQLIRHLDGLYELRGGTPNDRRVRYLGIDAPEIGDAGAEEATKANNKLVGGKQVRLELGKPERDPNGRLLALRLRR